MFPHTSLRLNPAMASDLHTLLLWNERIMHLAFALSLSISLSLFLSLFHSLSPTSLKTTDIIKRTINAVHAHFGKQCHERGTGEKGLISEVLIYLTGGVLSCDEMPGTILSTEWLHFEGRSFNCITLGHH